MLFSKCSLVQKEIKTNYMVIVILLLLQLGCSQSNEEIYSTVEIKDNLNFEFNDVSEDDMMSSRSDRYEVTRDSLDRIIEIKRISPKLRENNDFSFGVPTIKIDYQGQYENRSYFNKFDMPTKYNNFYLIRIKRETGSNLISWFGYNECGTLIKDYKGVHQYRILVNEKGSILEKMRFDRNGEPIEDNRGVFGTLYNYNDDDLVIEESDYNLQGKLTDSAWGYSTIRSKYDNNENRIEVSYCDANGMLFSDGDFGAIVKFSYDDQFNHIETIAYDIDSNLIIGNDAIRRLQYDQDGNLIGHWKFDQDTNLTSGFIHKYNKKGFMEEEHLLGSDSQLVLNKWSGAALKKYEYDNFGDVISISYFGIDGNPIINTYGYFERTNKYDSIGRVEEVCYWNESKQLVEDSLGIAKYNYTYWEDSLTYQKVECYGVNDQLKTDSKFDVAITQYTYDSIGQIKEDRYFGSDGRLTLRKNRGAAIIKFKHNEKGLVTEQSYYDLKEKLINRIDLNYAIIKQKYDDCGNLSEISYYDSKKALVADSVENAIYRWEYDEYNNTTRKYTYDVQSKLHEDLDGFAIYEYKWDEEGNHIYSATYGSDQKLKENDIGIAVFTYEYETNNKTFTIKWRDDQNNDVKFDRIFSKRFQRGSFNKFEMIENFDKFGKLTKDSNLVSVYKFKFDSVGNQIEESYFDTNNEPVKNKYGYAIIQNEYNENRSKVLTKYLDTREKLSEHKRYKCAMYKYEYDENGRHIKTIGFDKNSLIVGEWDQ